MIYGNFLFHNVNMQDPKFNQYIGTMHLLSGACRCRLIGQDESTNLIKHWT